jgi:hypothetical protein
LEIEDDEAIRSTLKGADLTAKEIGLELVNEADMKKDPKRTKCSSHGLLGLWRLDWPI